MSDSKKVKLFKIASEINIGRETIVEYLQSKGFDIQNKPTASLDEKMIDLVHEKFKKEKKAIDIQREKIQKHKDFRQDLPKKSAETKTHSTTESAEIKPTTNQSDVVENIINDDIDNFDTTSEDNDVLEQSTGIKKPIFLGKIELPGETKHQHSHQKEYHTKEHKKSSAKQTKDNLEYDNLIPDDVKFKIPDKISTAETIIDKVETEPKVEPTKEITQPKIDPLDKLTHKISDISKNESEPTLTEEKVEIKTIEETSKNVEPEIEEIHTITETQEQTPIDETSQIVDQPQLEGEYTNKKFDKKKKNKRPETEPGTSPQLKGLTVVGKIDLDKNKEKEKERQREIEQAREKAKAKSKEFHNRRDRDSDRTGDKDRDRDRDRDRFKDRDRDRDRNKDKDRGDKFQDGDKKVPTTTDKSKQEFDRNKPKQFKKRKHIQGSEPAPEFNDSIKEQLDQRFKVKDKDKEKEKINKDIIDKDEKKKKKKKKSIRESISQEEVNRAIRETLAGMDMTHASSRTKNKLKKKAEREEKEQKLIEAKLKDEKTLELTEFVTTSDIANLMGITPNVIIMKCMSLGLMVTINQRLDKDTIILIADDYGFEVEFLSEKESQFIEIDDDSEDELEPRPPIVTIMGHVDHGKTSLLDYIRNANVVAGEAGGITQHIGAYKVELPSNRTITFLDTPGHEAFTAMRARGAQVTDIVVLVVAADDSVMPQTIEAISHAKAANVPIIVAINKIDKPDANPDRIKQQLADQNILVEDWGGKYQVVEISSKKGINIDILLEKILLEADLLELKANPNRNAKGIVIESNMRQGFGPVATIIIQKGTLNIGDPFYAGVSFGKIRAMMDERERRINEALPGDPVLVVGFDEIPEAGDMFLGTNSDNEARETAILRKQLRREQELRQVHHKTLDEISAQIQIGGVKELNLVVKGDVAGSVEALADSLYKLSREEVKVNILHKGTGNITESDVMLAAASGAVVIGFNVVTAANAKKVVENEKIDVRYYNIIYDCINEIQLALEGLLTPDLKEEIVATIEIRKVFRISKYGSIAGCYVTSGKITRNDRVRIMRDGFKEFEGGIASLKRNKDDVREVDTGFECGIQIAGYNDIQEGDIIEAFKVVEVKRKLT